MAVILFPYFAFTSRICIMTRQHSHGIGIRRVFFSDFIDSALVARVWISSAKWWRGTCGVGWNTQEHDALYLT